MQAHKKKHTPFSSSYCLSQCVHARIRRLRSATSECVHTYLNKRRQTTLIPCCERNPVHEVFMVGTKLLYNKRKIMNSTPRHDAPSGVQSVRRRVATVALTFATPHRAVHVLVTNMSFVRDKIISTDKFMTYKIVSTLEIALSNIPWDVLVLHDWRRSITGTKWTPLLFAFLLTSF